MKLIMLEVLLKPECEEQHEFEMLLKYRWIAPILQKWKCESLANQITTSVVNSLQCCVLIQLSRKYYPSAVVYFILKNHISPTRVRFVHMKQDSCVWSSDVELCNEERAHNAGLPIPRTAGLPLVNDICCTYSDFVKWISAFSYKTNLCWSAMLVK